MIEVEQLLGYNYKAKELWMRLKNLTLQQPFLDGDLASTSYNIFRRFLTFCINHKYRYMQIYIYIYQSHIVCDVCFGHVYKN